MGHTMVISKWEDFLMFLLVKGKYSNTKSNIQGNHSKFRILCKFFEEKEFNEDNVQRFLYHVQSSGYSTSYLNNFLKMLKQYGRFLETKNPEFKNFMGSFTYYPEVENKMYDTFTPEDILKICTVEIKYRKDAKTNKKLNQKYQTLFWFLALTGCRINEALTLLNKDVHNTYVTFRITKTNHIRNVPIPKLLVDKLTALNPKPDPEELVFPSDLTGKVLDDTHVNDMLKKICAEVGVKKPKIFCHLFRHSLANELLKQGQSISIISQILGHAKIETTHRYYIHLQQEQLMDCLYSHPLLKEELDIGVVKKRINQMIDMLVDKNRFEISYSENQENLSFSIKERVRQLS